MMKGAVCFMLGIISLAAFVSTRFVHPDISRWYYLGDATLAIGAFAVALIIC